MKKAIIFLLLPILCIAGCKAKTVHCDNCGRELKIKESSNVTEEWVLYCDECNEELFDGDPLLDPTP